MRQGEKVNYLRKIVYEATWNGDQVRVEMEPLDRESFIRIWSLNGDAATQQVERYRTTMEILDKHIVSITGMVDAAGAPITKEVVLSKMFFSDLVNELGRILMEGSTVPKAKSSASAERLPATTEARQ